MKTMKAKVIALILVVALALTGCMQEEIQVSIKSDGSGKLTAVTSIDKTEFEKALKDEGFTSSDITEYWNTLEEAGYKKVTIDDKEYYQMTNTENVKKGEMSKEFSDIDSNAYITADTFYVTIDAKKIMGVDDLSELADGQKVDTSSIKFTVSVEFAKKIVNTNGKIDTSNPNKATFTIPVERARTVFATTKSGVTAATVKDNITKENTVKAPKIKKLKANKVAKKAKKATVTLKIGKVSGIKKYNVEWATKKNFSNSNTATIKKLTYTIKKLKKNKKYYVRVRAQKENSVGVTVYSKWTKQSVKTKK